MCKGHLTNQILFWDIRGSEHTTYVTTYKDYLTDQNILSDKSEALLC